MQVLGVLALGFGAACADFDEEFDIAEMFNGEVVPQSLRLVKLMRPAFELLTCFEDGNEVLAVLIALVIPLLNLNTMRGQNGLIVFG